MKAGYAALFSLVVAYSAYQGTGSLSPDSSQSTTRQSSDAVSSRHVRSYGLLPGAEPLPSIDGGICPLKVNESGGAPCGACKAICPASGLRDLISDYFGPEPANETADAAKFREEHWNVPKPAQTTIKFIVASIPDPVHTHMALLFDRGIETIQRSAQANGYLFSRAWMPWEISSHSESPDFSVRMAQTKYRDQVELLPGLMIFQKSVTNSAAELPILFVFVVGETPTGGLRMEQFQNALKIRQSILGSQPNTNVVVQANGAPEAEAKALSESEVLRIYGPTFSGSLLSLDTILNAQPHDRFCSILIRSGSVTSYTAVRDFLQKTNMQWRDPTANHDCNPVHVGRPNFATFQFSDAYQEFYLSLFFYDRHELHSHVAVLSEDETAFGNQELGGDEKSDPTWRPRPQPLVPLMRLYFPREIAQLRDAYQQNIKLQSSGGTGSSQQQNGLSLSLSVTGNDDDSVAAYSPLQTPLSQESILQAIVASLRRQHAKVVIIRATDPLDTIFLSRYLRQNYPQARLVTVGADLLMVHEFYDPRFHGILAVTPYPIVTGTQFPSWNESSTSQTANQLLNHGEATQVERLFPDSYSVGDFNAFQSLLARDADAKPNGAATDRQHPELPAASYSQFGLLSFLPADTGPWRAHLWLTTIGRDGYWPVSVLDDVSAERLHQIEDEKNIGKEKKKTITKPDSTIRDLPAPLNLPAQYSVHLSVSWTIFWMLTFGLTVFVSFLIAFPRVFSHSEILARFAESPSSARNCLLFTGSMLLLVAQTLFLFPAIIWFVQFGQCDAAMSVWQCASEAFNGMWLILVCYFFSVLCLGAAYYRGFKRRGNRLLAWTGVAICTAAATAAPVLAWYGPWENLNTGFGNFLYRYINVGSGVSPLLPLLFLVGAWIWWCWQSLTGITSMEEKQLVLPHASDFDKRVSSEESGAPMLTAAECVRLKAFAAKDKEWPWKTLGAAPFGLKLSIPAALGLIVILLLMRPSEIAEAFEPNPYRGVYWALLYLSLFLVCYLIVHIVGLWLQFRSLLQAIERMPFRRGFRDSRNLTWKPLWKLAGNGTTDFLELLRGELDALAKIQNSKMPVGNLTVAGAEVQRIREKLAARYQNLIDCSRTGNHLRVAFRVRVTRRFNKVLRKFRNPVETNDRSRATFLTRASQWFKSESLPTPKPVGSETTNPGEKASQGSMRDLQRLFRNLQGKLATAAFEALLYDTRQWSNEPYSAPAENAKDSNDNHIPEEPPARDPATRAVEYFLCLFYLNIILAPLRRLQTLILALAGVFVFVMISYSSYPFESRESFHALLISIFFAISVVVGVVYGQMYANPLLSRITNTTPGELGLDFWVRLGTFVFIPLLSLISAQFPAVNSFLFSWLEPALQSIK
jgi:hypothetical protein